MCLILVAVTGTLCVLGGLILRFVGTQMGRAYDEPTTLRGRDLETTVHSLQTTAVWAVTWREIGFDLFVFGCALLLIAAWRTTEQVRSTRGPKATALPAPVPSRPVVESTSRASSPVSEVRDANERPV